MKKLLFIFILLLPLFPSTCLGWNQAFFNTIGSSGAVDTYSDILLFVTFENCGAPPCTAYTMGSDDYSAGDQTLTFNNNAEINAASALVGTYGLDCPGVEDYVQLSVSGDIIFSAEGRIATKIYVTTWVNSTDVITWFDVGGGNDQAKVELNTNDELRTAWKDNSTTRTEYTTPAANLGTTTEYCIEFAWKTSTDYREFFVDGVSKGSDANTIGTFGTESTHIRFGIASNNASDIWLDNFMISSDSTRDLNALCDLTTSPK